MTLLLTAADIAALIADVDVVKAVETIHADLGVGCMIQPAPVSLGSDGDDAVFLPMAARSDRLGLAAVRLMADIPANASRDLPSQRSTLLVSSVDTGECVAVLDGALITRYRTAAASVVATRLLARSDARTLGLVGAGNLAVRHAIAFGAEADIRQFTVWSRSAATGARFLELAGPQIASRSVVAPDPLSVVESSDIICTLTPSVQPVVRGEWLQPGQHVNAVGARPRPTHRELDGTAMARGVIVVDSAPTAMAKSGDLLEAMREGAVRHDAPLRELGSIVVGRAPGRTSRDEITIYDSVGIAAQDLAVGAAIIDLALDRGTGQRVTFPATPSVVAI